MELVATDTPLSATIIGRLDSPQNVEIRARVEGFVDKIPFTEGVEVKKGELLFELDKKPFEESLAAAEGARQEAIAARNKYQQDVERLRPLAEKKAIPQQDLDNALASVEVGEAGVATAEAQLHSAQLDLDYCVMKAPITGLVGAAQVSIGELVGKGEPTLLTTISTLDPIWFYCNLGETEYLKARQKSQKTGVTVEDLPVTLLLSNGNEHPDKGKFVFIDRAINTTTGTIRVRAEFPNKDKILRPGMFARVLIDLGKMKNAILVPERALVELQGKSFLWVISDEGTASQRPVTVGEQTDSHFIVLDGVKAGERIIVEGIQKVREGSKVTAMTSEQIAAMSSGGGAKPANK